MFLERSSPVFHHVIKDIGHRIVESTGEKRSTSYLMHANHWNGYSAWQQQLYIGNCCRLQEVG